MPNAVVCSPGARRWVDYLDTETLSGSPSILRFFDFRFDERRDSVSGSQQQEAPLNGLATCANFSGVCPSAALVAHWPR